MSVATVGYSFAFLFALASAILIYAGREFFKPKKKQSGPAQHKWDEEGEHCVKCGDADWYASSVCSEVKLNKEV